MDKLSPEMEAAIKGLAGVFRGATPESLNQLIKSMNPNDPVGDLVLKTIEKAVE